MPHRQQPPLTDLEARVYRALKSEFAPLGELNEDAAKQVARISRVAVAALTSGSGSGRRLRTTDRRPPDPGCTPEKLRRLAERIEDSYTDMPRGWKRLRDIDEERLYG